MVDPKTGCIVLSETLQIKVGATIDAVKYLNLSDNQSVIDRHNGWKWLTVKNLPVNEQYYIVSFGFQADALKQIDLIVSKDRFDLSANWSDWSETKELNLLTELRIWVKNELGREGTFDWGNIRAAYDQKGGSSSITITYK